MGKSGTQDNLKADLHHIWSISPPLACHILNISALWPNIIIMKEDSKHLHMVESFEQYIADGGDILSFAEYFNTQHVAADFRPYRDVIILALCEEYASLSEYDRIYQILHTVFSVERWSLKKYKRFMEYVKVSPLLAPLHESIFMLHENCKNYFRSV
jgi:hypothetical protein